VLYHQEGITDSYIYLSSRKDDGFSEKTRVEHMHLTYPCALI